MNATLLRMVDALKHSWYWLLLAGGLLALALSEHHPYLDEILRRGNDPLGYYQFLPALLIDHDLGALAWVHVTESGQHISLFTIGVALLQLPFFLLGHLLALASGAPLTGYSWPYAITHLLSAAVYCSAGMSLLSASLRKEFPRTTVLIVLALTLLGTNLLYYAVREPGMSHVYSFFLFAWLWYLVINEHGRWWMAKLCVCATLIVLVRPLNGVVLLLPLLLNRPLIKRHFQRGEWRPLGVGVALTILLLLPQLLYWHACSGRWLLFTYGVKGEGFDWSAPHLMDVLFSHQNGWFLYGPIMLPVMAALFWHADHRRPGARAILLVWGLTWYAYGSWWAWWLGAAFGFRGFVDMLPLLALPMAWLVQRIISGAAWLRIVSSVGGGGFLVLLNLRMTTIYQCCWDGADWTWDRLLAVWKEALWLS